MAHAHPSPDGLCLPPERARNASSSKALPVARALVSSSRPPGAPCPHSRRLQLRNAGFRGPVIPGRRITPPPTPVFDPASRLNKETPPQAADRQATFGKDSSQHTGTILQEISNTARRRRDPNRPSMATIFQDSTMDEENTPWDSNGTRRSPPALTMSSFRILHGAQEISLDEKAQQFLPSPPVQQPRERKKPGMNVRSTGFEAEQYIETLEAEVASLNTRLQSLTSPTSTKVQSLKFRTLTNQVNSLRQEVAEWENKFGERVTDEVFQRTRFEADLKGRIKSLEDDAEAKDTTIRQLEDDLETAQARLQEAELLERHLGKRVDVLSDLLVVSPPQFDYRTAPSTPGKSAPTKRPPRPWSMMLQRTRSSPVASGTLSMQAGDVLNWDNRDIKFASSVPESSLEDTFSVPDQASRFSKHAVSIDLTDSVKSLRSGTSSSSRPTSLLSMSSVGSSWGLPLSAEDGSKSPGRARKMRRFPSGSNTLKPLILRSTAAAPQSRPVSAAGVDHRTGYRDLTDASFDPTTAFLSKVLDDPPNSTPTNRLRRRSVSWARNQALRALEGSLHCRDDIPEEDCKPGAAFNNAILPDELTLPLQDDLGVHGHELTLQHELKHARVVSSCYANGSQAEGHEDFYLPRSAPRQHSLDAVATDGTLQLIPDRLPSAERRFVASSPLTPRASNGPPPIVPLLRAVSSASTKSAPTDGIFSRLSNMVTCLRTEPVCFARRIVQNSWARGSSRLGGLGWWLLGLIHRSRKRPSHPADTGEVAKEECGDMAWHRLSMPMESMQRSPLRGGRRHRDRGAEDAILEEGSLLGGPEVPVDYGSVRSKRSMVSERKSVAVSTAFQSHRSPGRCGECVEPASKRNLKLWCKLFLALVLAVGVAVLEGPDALLSDPRPSPERDLEAALPEETGPLVRETTPVDARMASDRQQPNSRITPDPGNCGARVTFVRNLTPNDFERRV